MPQSSKETQIVVSNALALGPFDKALLLTKREVAHLFDVKPAAVTNWSKAGMPATDFYVEDSGERLYHAKHVLEWVMSNIYNNERASLARGRTQEDLRMKRLRADKLELDIKKRAGELVPMSAAIGLLNERIASAKARLLALPTRIAPRVAKLTSPTDVQKEAQEVVEEALQELRPAAEQEVYVQ